MDRQHIGDLQVLFGRKLANRQLHRVDVAKYCLRGDVIDRLAYLPGRFRARETPDPNFQALNARRSDRFGTQQKLEQALRGS